MLNELKNYSDFTREKKVEIISDVFDKIIDDKAKIFKFSSPIGESLCYATWQVL